MPDEIKTNATVSTDVKGEVDWEKKFLEVSETLNQVAAERENYKKVALSKKGKSSDGEDEDLEEKMRRIAREERDASYESQLLKEKDEIAKRVLKENKELKVALQNRGQVASSAAGASEPNEGAEGKAFWTEAQLDYFKKRGIDPNKVKDNYLKIKQK